MEDFLSLGPADHRSGASFCRPREGPGRSQGLQGSSLAERETWGTLLPDFKMPAMRLTIANWYDDLREARGLEPPGPRA